MKRSRRLAVLFLVSALVGCHVPGRRSPYEAIGSEASTLRQRFNADAGKVRVLMLVGPTCGMCLRGASDIEKQVLAKIADPRLRAYAVWVPMLGAREKDVADATATVGDARARHFWDGDGYLINAFMPVLGLKERAWDIYMVYGPAARWDGAVPPTPDFWMHQLATPDPALTLDASVVGARVTKALGALR